MDARWATLSCRTAILLAVFTLLAPIAPFGQSTARTFIDAAQRSVVVPGRIEKVLAAGPPAATALYTLAPGKLAGWPRPPGPDARAFMPERYADLPVHSRLTGHAEPAYEHIVAMRPDLIIDIGTVNPAYAAIAERAQQATKISYLLLDGSLPATPALYRALGDLLGEPARAADLATRSTAMLDSVRDRVGALTLAERKRVYVARGPGGNDSWTAGSFNAEIIELAGAVNVVTSAEKLNPGDISPERVTTWNPDVIIALDPAFLRTIETDMAWRQVPAVAAGNVYLAPQRPFGWTDDPPSVNRLLGLRWLAGLLHAERFADDIRGLTRDFYAAFYHVTLDDPQLDQLLRGAIAVKR